MHYDMIIAGVGGQGILSIATVIGRGVLQQGLHLKQSEVHGMAQRGGAVQSHLRIADRPIHSDLIPLGSAHMILAMEPMEGLRYLPWMAKDGWLVTNSVPVPNIPNYPPEKEWRAAVEAVPHHLLVDAVVLARETGAPRGVNMVMLGLAAPFMGLASTVFEEAIRSQFSRKGEEVVAGNIAVFKAGYALALEHKKTCGR